MVSGPFGADFSVNVPAPPMAGYVLLQTIPANSQRQGVELQNQSASTLQVVVDDGVGGNTTTWLLAGIAANAPGQAFQRIGERARILIYGPAGSQVAAREYV